MLNDHYPLSSDTTDLSRFTEHRVAIDGDTFRELLVLDEDKVEARAAELGIPVNQGIIPIMVDGERRFIETDLVDFGTRVRNVVETEKTQENGTISRGLGDAALDAAAAAYSDSDVKDVDQQVDHETSTSPEQFSRDIGEAINKFLMQPEFTDGKLAEEAVLSIETERGRMQQLLEDANKHLILIRQAIYGGGEGLAAASSRLGAIVDLLTQAQTSTQQQYDTARDMLQDSGSLKDRADKVISDLDIHEDQSKNSVMELIATNQLNDRAANESWEEPLAKSANAKSLLRQFEDATESLADDAHRIMGVNEGLHSELYSLLSRAMSIQETAQRGQIDAETYDTFYYGAQLLFGQYKEAVNPPVTHLRSSLEQVNNTKRSMQDINV